jgi:hypothetical protein
MTIISLLRPMSLIKLWNDIRGYESVRMWVGFQFGVRGIRVYPWTDATNYDHFRVWMNILGKG